MLTSSGLSSKTQDVTWEMEHVPIIAATPDAEAASTLEVWDADLQGSYVPPMPQVLPVLLVSMVPPALPGTPVTATVPFLMTPGITLVMTLALPLMPPPPSLMSPPSRRGPRTLGWTKVPWALSTCTVVKPTFVNPQTLFERCAPY